MRKFAYLSLGIVYCLLFGEVFMRLFNPVALMPRYVTAAPYGVRMNVPNVHYWQTTPETRIQVRMNAQGIRADREYTYQKPENTCRIVLLGDSFFVGYEVDLKDSFAYLLEKALRTEGYPCEVINLAVSGFGTAEMLVTLQQEGLKYQPDIVVFQWHRTDFFDNMRAGLFRVNKAGQLVHAKTSYLPAVGIRDWLGQFAIYRFLIENSQLYSAIREAAANQIKLFMVALSRKQLEEPTDESEKLIEKNSYATRLSVHLLQEAKRLSNTANAFFCVLDIPSNRSRVKFESTLSNFEPEIREQLKMFSPIQTFTAASNPETKLFFERGHFHLTPLGNQLLTDYFLSELKATGWLTAFQRATPQ